MEAGATENGLGAGLERHRRRVKVGGPGRIEDRFAVHAGIVSLQSTRYQVVRQYPHLA